MIASNAITAFAVSTKYTNAKTRSIGQCIGSPIP
jgi:hypothetical protein